MMNLTCGFLAIVVADLHVSSLLLMAGMFFDMIDGLIARLLKVSSDIGRELDSLADLVSFGVAPAYLYSFIAPYDGWSMYIPPLFIVVGSALRLAIFNIRPQSKYFIGLATPASTFFLVGLFIGVRFDSQVMQSIIEYPSTYFLIPIFLFVMMLSKIRMFSFKQLGQSLNYNILILVCFLIFAALIYFNYKLAMPLGVLIYIVLSVIYSVRIRRKNRAK